jgi:hypothetical protein
METFAESRGQFRQLDSDGAWCRYALIATVILLVAIPAMPAYYRTVTRIALSIKVGWLCDPVGDATRAELRGGEPVSSTDTSMRKCSKVIHNSLTELNITPLLDLAFVLLVIFIITTTPIVNDLALNLPKASSHPKDAPRKANYVTVEASGVVYLNKKRVASRNCA